MQYDNHTIHSLRNTNKNKKIDAVRSVATNAFKVYIFVLSKCTKTAWKIAEKEGANQSKIVSSLKLADKK